MRSSAARARPHARGPRRSDPVARCRRKFLSYFPGGFRDAEYVATEREYKWAAHERWLELLSPEEMRALVRRGRHAELARRAVAIESRTNLLFSFEKMAVRDALKRPEGAREFAEGLLELLSGGPFERWIESVRRLPRKQTRVLTWPVLTVFPFLARPTRDVFLKPVVTRRAADAYGFDFEYRSRPDEDTYASLLAFARRVRADQRDLHPRDMIDAQSFLWVLGSDEYPD